MWRVLMPPDIMDEDEGTQNMPREATRPKGWLSDRLDPLGWSVRGLSEMLDENYKQAMRWNSGVYDPPAPVMEWLGKVERFFAENPPPKHAEYSAARTAVAAEKPPAFVQRIIDAMKPGETATVEDIEARIGARRKAVQNRLSAASIEGRLGPLRRVEGGVYRAKDGEVPPGASLKFDPVVEPAAPTFVGRILDVVMPGETVEIAKVARRIGMRPDALHRQVVKAAEANRLGPIERVGEDCIRRVEDDHGDKAPVPETKQAPVPPPAPTAAPPPATPAPQMTVDRIRECLGILGLSQRKFGSLLRWPDLREARRWFSGEKAIPSEVAGWLEQAVQAKEAAIQGLPPGAREAEIAARVGAAVAAAAGTLDHAREAALAARRATPHQERAPADEITLDPLEVAASDAGSMSMQDRAILRVLKDAWRPQAALPFSDAEMQRARSKGLAERGTWKGDAYWCLSQAGAERKALMAKQREDRVSNREALEKAEAVRRPGFVPGVSARRCIRLYHRLTAMITGDMEGAPVNPGLRTAVRSAMLESYSAGMSLEKWKDAALERLRRTLPPKGTAPDELRRREQQSRIWRAEAAADPSIVPGVSVTRFTLVQRRLLRWIAAELGSLDAIPPNDPAYEDTRAALKATHSAGMSNDEWVAAAQKHLETMGYELDDEDEPADEEPKANLSRPMSLEDILPPDYSGPSGRRGGRFVDLTKDEG